MRADEACWCQPPTSLLASVGVLHGAAVLGESAVGSCVVRLVWRWWRWQAALRFEIT